MLRRFIFRQLRAAFLDGKTERLGIAIASAGLLALIRITRTGRERVEWSHKLKPGETLELTARAQGR